MARISRPFFSLSYPNLSQPETMEKKEDNLIIDEDTIYELDEECLSCRQQNSFSNIRNSPSSNERNFRYNR